nr:hypothetical protein GCM10020093_035580 [Planobispora longispora]
MGNATVQRLSRPALVAALAGGVLLAGALPVAAAGPTASTASAASAAYAKGTLGPFGYGGVKLGMSAKQAKATGKIKRTGDTGTCTTWILKAHPNAQGLLISKRYGVAAIFAPKGVATPRASGSAPPSSS